MMMMVSFPLQVGNFITGIGNVICDKCEVGLADTRVTVYFVVLNFWEFKPVDHL